MIGEIIREVKDGMLGRMADESSNVSFLLEAVEAAGDGDYLEIGVLHGGSLCAAALLKRRLGHKGKCYGIDPLNGYYIEKCPWRKNGLDIESKIPVTPETVAENLRRFRLEHSVEIIQANSHPLPEAAKRKYAVAYIDGNHWGDGPINDWLNVSPLVTRFVVFDNYDGKHPDVLKTCNEAATDKHWEIYLRRGITFILQRAA